MAEHVCNLSTWEARGRRTALGLRPDWSTQQVPYQPGPYGETLSHRQINKQTKNQQYNQARSKDLEMAGYCIILKLFLICNTVHKTTCHSVYMIPDCRLTCEVRLYSRQGQGQKCGPLVQNQEKACIAVLQRFVYLFLWVYVSVHVNDGAGECVCGQKRASSLLLAHSPPIPLRPSLSPDPGLTISQLDCKLAPQ